MKNNRLKQIHTIAKFAVGFHIAGIVIALTTSIVQTQKIISQIKKEKCSKIK